MPTAVFKFGFKPIKGRPLVWTGSSYEPATIAGTALSGFTAARVAFGSSAGGLTDSANFTFDGSKLTLLAASGTSLDIDSTEACTSPTTGSAVLGGGLGVGGTGYFGGTTDATASAGGLQSDGGARVTKRLVISGTSSFSGGITVPYFYNTATQGLVVIGGAGSSEALNLCNNGGSNVFTAWPGVTSCGLGGGSALATSATDGFLYIAKCAGTPTGTPTSRWSGNVLPMVIDSTNRRFYFYDTVWRRTNSWTVASTVTAAATTTLTVSSAEVQTFTGATTQTVQFPAANLHGAGVPVVFCINNQSSGTVTPTRAGADTFQGGGTTDPVLAGATQWYASDSVSVWLKI